MSEPYAGDEDAAWALARRRMVERDLIPRKIRDPRVLAAMREIPRHLFIPPHLRDKAYNDHPLPIGHEQTISQPYIVAYMCELAELEPEHRVLEIGCGSGYQAAALARLCAEVYTLEIVADLIPTARAALARAGANNVTARHGDGHHGWPEAAPFDAILLAAAPLRAPTQLIEQLKPGGRLIAPVGGENQELIRIRRGSDLTDPTEHTIERVIPVRFVPMTGGDSLE